MPVHQERQLQLRSHAVRSGNQGGLFHILKALHGEGSGKSAQSAKYFGPHGLLHIFFHQFHRFITGFDIHSGILIIHFYLHVLFLSFLYLLFCCSYFA